MTTHLTLTDIAGDEVVLSWPHGVIELSCHNSRGEFDQIDLSPVKARRLAIKLLRAAEMVEDDG